MDTTHETIQQKFEHSLSKASRGLVIRGLIAIAFGIALAVWPDISFHTIVLVVAAFALVDGIVSLVTAFQPMRSEDRVWLVFQGLAGITIGVVTYFYPDITAVALLFVVGAWAIILGVAGLFLAAKVEGGDRFLVILFSLLCIAFGMLMFVRPGSGALALVALIAAFAIVMGTTLVVLGIQVQRKGEESLNKVFSVPESPTTDKTDTSGSKVS
jgi:uncharacterized membrane protein HdeD (DUF308 family)